MFTALYTSRPPGEPLLSLVFAHRDPQTADDIAATVALLRSQGETVETKDFERIFDVPESLLTGPTPDDDTIHDTALRCLQILSGVCDGAVTRDDLGFNGTDSHFGKSLAAQDSLSPKQLACALKILRKYRKQLPPTLYSILYGASAAGVSSPPPPNPPPSLPSLPSPDAPSDPSDPSVPSVPATPRHAINRKYIDLATGQPHSGQDIMHNGSEEPYGDTYQLGVLPGPKKLAQFHEVLLLMSTPRLYAQENKGEEAIVYVKLFDPCGSWTWYITEYDPAQKQAFGLVDDHEAEYGYIDLTELSEVRGAAGIGIEIDMHFSPRPLKEVRESN